MAPIYSQQLASEFVTGPFASVVYTAPAGSTVVVTDIDTWLENSAANQTSFVELGGPIFLYRVSPAAEAINQQWRGRQVIYGGTTIFFNFNGSVASIAITGYVLMPI